MFENLFNFIKRQKANIIITMLGGLLPTVLNWIKVFIDRSSTTRPWWLIEPQQNYLFQSIFVLITLYVLIQVRRFVMQDLKNSEELIKDYIKKNCGIKIFNPKKTVNSAFRTVQETVSQFFYAWLAVWLMWLIYYGGGFLLSFSSKSIECFCCCNNCIDTFCDLGCTCKQYVSGSSLSNNKTLMATYQYIFDFLNSTAIFAIYIILTNVTVNYKERVKSAYIYLEPILAWMVVFIIFIAGLLMESYVPNHLFAKIMPFYVGVISTITLVLVLGKMNSTYLKVPRIFMFVLYIYALIQLYIPFKDLLVVDNCWFSTSIKIVLPYITLLGKIVLMLTICWIAVQRRFLFFVIHRSTTIDRTDELLSELNKENVSF